MSGVKYQLNILSPAGDLLDVDDAPVSLAFGRKVNEIGAFSHMLRYKFWKYMRPDIQFEVYRSENNGPLMLEFNTRWLGLTFERGKIGNPFIVSGPDLVDMARRAIVNYDAGSAQAAKTGPYDDQIKAVGRENLVSGGAGAGRGYANFTVRPDLSAAPAGPKAFSRKVVLDVFKDLVKAAAAGGTYLAFDILLNGTNFELVTYTGSRGPDNTFKNSGLIFSAENGTLTNVKRIDDYSSEATKVFAGGTGTEADRLIGVSPDDPRALISPYYYIEAWKDARNVKDQAGVDAEAAAGLESYRARRQFTADLLPAPGVKYRRDYSFGSLITAEYDNEYMDCRIDAISVSWDSNGEKVSAKIQNIS